MRQYLFFLLLIIIGYTATAQDLIVTNEGDSIECKITRISDDFIHFSVIDKSGVLLMRSRLPVSKVAYYEQADTPTDSSDEEVPYPERAENVSVEYFEPAKYRLSLTTGYTYQLGGYEGLPSSYKKQVQSLWNFGAEFDIYLSETIGLGLKYSHAYTKANENFDPFFSSAFGFSSLTDEKIKFNYYGLALVFRNYNTDQQVMNYFISAGLTTYRTDGFGDGIPFYQEGDTFGFILGVSYDFILMKSLGLGVGAEINIARLSEFDNNGNVVLADFNLTRIDLTVGVRLFK